MPPLFSIYPNENAFCPYEALPGFGTIGARKWHTKPGKSEFFRPDATYVTSVRFSRTILGQESVDLALQPSIRIFG